MVDDPSYLISFRAPRPPVLLQHLSDALSLKVRVDGFVPATEYDAREAVKLFEAHRRRRVERHDAHDGRLDVRRRAEVVLAHVHHVVDLGVELHVRGQTRPERGTGLRDEPHRELALEHQYGHAEERSVRQEAEDERGRDLVGRVGDADVEVGELRLDEIADYDLEPALLGPGMLHGAFFWFCEKGGLVRRQRGGVRGWEDVLALHALCEFCGHPGVHFHGRAVLCLVQY
jgi:hypothetical protein